jgi:DNA-binding NtrC family response regulator
MTIEPPACIHITDDTPDFLEVITRDLIDQGCQVVTSISPAETRVTSLKQEFDLFIVDLWCPELADGLELIDFLRKNAPDTPVLAISATVRIDDALAALRTGAADFLQKPFAPPRLFLTVQSLIERRELRKKVSQLDEQARRSSGLIGNSRAMDELWKDIQKAAAVDWPVLVRGESGCGKTIVARAIHQLSGRAGNACEILNCADLNPTLVDDELFGHERGAFTGANERHIGIIDQADAGTLVLDEIGDLPLTVQGRLLRVLESNEFRRLGGEKNLISKARIIVATHRDLEQRVREGVFRRDLLYRLNVLQIHVPPLRDRGEDIRQLATWFLEQVRRELDLERLEFAPETLDYLARQEYRENNVRELEHLVRRLGLQSKGEIVKITPETFDNDDPPLTGTTLNTAVREFEAGFIRKRLVACSGQISRTAESLGISRVQLWRRMNELGLREDGVI